MRYPFILLAGVLAAAGCSTDADGTKAPLNASSTAGETEPDQANLCEVSEWRHDDVARTCKPGQKVVYLPQSFGNEQLPIFFAAVNCDLRYSVALTTGAVTCIYGPITPKDAGPAAASGKPAL